MLSTLRTLFLGANARAEEAVRDTFAIDLIDQKIREADEGLRAAKGTELPPENRTVTEATI